MRRAALVVRIILDIVYFVVIDIFDDHLYGVLDDHSSHGMLVEMISDSMLEKRRLYDGIALGYSDKLAEIADSFRRISPLLHTAERRHSRIVPTGYEAFVDEFFQISFAHYSAFDIEPCEFHLSRSRRKTAVYLHPIVKRSVILELERT